MLNHRFEHLARGHNAHIAGLARGHVAYIVFIHRKRDLQMGQVADLDQVHIVPQPVRGIKAHLSHHAVQAGADHLTVIQQHQLVALAHVLAVGHIDLADGRGAAGILMLLAGRHADSRAEALFRCDPAAPDRIGLIHQCLLCLQHRRQVHISRPGHRRQKDQQHKSAQHAHCFPHDPHRLHSNIYIIHIVPI